jgi:hypothetical protein
VPGARPSVDRPAVAAQICSLTKHCTVHERRDAGEIERAVAAFARAPNGGLIVTGTAAKQLHRDLTIPLAAQYKQLAVAHFVGLSQRRGTSAIREKSDVRLPLSVPPLTLGDS